MSEKLRECPFCGGNNIRLSADSFLYDVRYFAKCSDCGAYLPAKGRDIYEAEANFVKKWNTRAEQTCEWVMAYKSPDYAVFNTSCGNLFKWNDGVPDHCPGCGARVVTE